MRKTIILTLIITHLIFFLIKISLGNYFLVDSYEYLQLSENILTHFEFYSYDLNAEIDYASYTKRPPLYAIFILITSFLLQSTVLTLIVQNILSVFSILIALKIFESYYSGLNKPLFLIF